MDPCPSSGALRGQSKVCVNPTNVAYKALNTLLVISLHVKDYIYAKCVLSALAHGDDDVPRAQEEGGMVRGHGAGAWYRARDTGDDVVLVLLQDDLFLGCTCNIPSSHLKYTSWFYTRFVDTKRGGIHKGRLYVRLIKFNV